MQFKKLSKTANEQNVRLLTSKKFKIEALVTIKENRIQDLALSLQGKDYRIESALLCTHVINDDSLYLQINVINKENHNNTVKVIMPENNLELKKGTLLFTGAHVYKDSKDEITSCKIDIFDMEFNPKERNGQILVIV